jgi:hypothetical protein
MICNVCPTESTLTQILHLPVENRRLEVFISFSARRRTWIG